MISYMKIYYMEVATQNCRQQEHSSMSATKQRRGRYLHWAIVTGNEHEDKQQVEDYTRDDSEIKAVAITEIDVHG